MKVLFLTASYPSPDGPAVGIFVKEHARAAARQADVAVVHLERADVRRVRVVREPDEFPLWRATYPRHPAPLSYAGNLAAAVAALRRVRLAGFSPDVLHAHFFLAGAPAVVLGRMLRKPVVLTEHWSVFLADDPTQLSQVVRRTAKFAFEHADLVLPVSEALRNGIVAHGVDARFRVVPNVFDESLFHPNGASEAREPKRLLSVGAFYPAKGYDVLLQAISLLAERRRDFRLAVIGAAGETRPECDALRQRLGLEDVVSFLGLLPKEEVARRMRAADLFVLTSRYDNNPCALIEALASGLPAVATAVGGIPEMLSAASGALARPGDPEDVAAKLDECLDRLDTFDRAAIAADARARYGRPVIAQALAEVYDQVLAGAP